MIDGENKKSYDNYVNNKLVYAPQRVAVFDNDGASTKPTLKGYDVQKLINNVDIYNNAGYVQDIMYKAKFLEDENRRLRFELEDKEATIKLLEESVNEKNTKSPIILSDNDIKTSNRFIIELQSQLKNVRAEKKKLEQRVRQLENSFKDEEFKLKLKMEENYRQYMIEHEMRLVLDLMTNGDNLTDKFFRDHIIKLNKDYEDLKNHKAELGNHPNIITSTIDPNSSLLKVKELEAENRNILARYYEF